MTTIQTVARLRELLGEPNPQVPRKIHRRLNRQAIDFIARSPMLFLATCDAGGQASVSPKGDGAGFVHVKDETTLLIPERKGNKLLFSLQNILVNPRVALLFTVPGTGETLRVAGTAQLLEDAQLCQTFEERGQPALLVIRVRVAECYFHCAKAFLRSQLWDTESWREPVRVSFGEEIAQNGGLQAEEVAAFDAAVHGRYRTDL